MKKNIPAKTPAGKISKFFGRMRTSLSILLFAALGLFLFCEIKNQPPDGTGFIRFENQASQNWNIVVDDKLIAATVHGKPVGNSLSPGDKTDRIPFSSGWHLICAIPADGGKMVWQSYFLKTDEAKIFLIGKSSINH